MKPILLTIIALFFLASCASFTAREETLKQKDKIKEALYSCYTNRLVITVSDFSNTEASKDLDYLSSALADQMISLLRPLENEGALIPLEKQPFLLTAQVSNLLFVSNSVFSNYLTNIRQDYTQYSEKFETHTNEVTVTRTNWTEVKGSKKKLEKIEMTTNQVISVITNRTYLTNYITNTYGISEESFISLITNEYRDLAKLLQIVPITIQKATNESTNLYSMKITGSYRGFESRNGPNEIELNLQIQYQTDQTNQIRQNLKEREDSISGKLAGLLKPLRQALLNRTTGDISINSVPTDANLYLDGTYIGKTPVYYPAVAAGTHQFTFLKEGFQEITVSGTVMSNITNDLTQPISRMVTGGTVTIHSAPTNCAVFIDSSFRGVTPLVISNLTIGVDHRLRIEPLVSNIVPYYHVFRLGSVDSEISINAQMMPYEGSSELKKKVYWSLTAASWGVTVGTVGWMIFNQYQASYHYDQALITGNLAHSSLAAGYEQQNKNVLYLFAVSGLASMGITALALYNEEIYMGMLPEQKDQSGFGLAVKF